MQNLGLLAQRIAPADIVVIERVVCVAPSVSAVPMHAVGRVHVETNQQDFVSAKLNREIDRLKTRIAAVADDARLLEQHQIVIDNLDLVNVFVRRADAGIVSELRALELGQTILALPPRPVAAVNNFRP